MGALTFYVVTELPKHAEAIAQLQEYASWDDGDDDNDDDGGDEDGVMPPPKELLERDYR